MWVTRSGCIGACPYVPFESGLLHSGFSSLLIKPPGQLRRPLGEMRAQTARAAQEASRSDASTTPHGAFPRGVKCDPGGGTAPRHPGRLASPASQSSSASQPSSASVHESLRAKFKIFSSRRERVQDFSRPGPCKEGQRMRGRHGRRRQGGLLAKVQAGPLDL